MIGNTLRNVKTKGARAGAFLLLLCLLYPMLPQAGLVSVSASSRDKKWRKDLKTLRKKLEGLHPNLYFKVTADEFNRAADELDGRIPQLQDHEIVVGMTRLVAMIGDSHTRLDWEQTGFGSPYDFRTYPLGLRWMSDGLYVTGATTPYRRALGARLVGIGESSLEQALASVSSLIPHENEQWLKARSPIYLVVPEILNALKILPDMQSGRFVFEDAGGNRFTLDFSPVTRGVIAGWVPWPDASVVATPMYQKKPLDYYWFDYLPDSRAVYLKYNQCAEMSGLPASTFGQQLASFVNSHAVERLVLDMRDNTGGDTSVLFRILAGLQNRGDLNSRGHFFVVLGRSTFSSAVNNAIALKASTEALFFGEATGGKPNSYGEIVTFTLPKSGLAVTCSTRFFKLVEGDPPSLAPDVSVQISSDDYLNGRDPVLEEILKR